MQHNTIFLHLIFKMNLMNILSQIQVTMCKNSTIPERIISLSASYHLQRKEVTIIYQQCMRDDSQTRMGYILFTGQCDAQLSAKMNFKCQISSSSTGFSGFFILPDVV